MSGYPYKVCDEQFCDYNYLRHSGWQEGSCLPEYFSGKTVDMISKKVTQLTKGVDPQNRNIIVPKDAICKIMDGVYQRYTPPVGDIFTRYILPSNEQQNMVQSMIDQTIEILVSTVKNSLEMEQANQKLSAWVQVYGDFNTNGLRYYPPIKVSNRRSSTMQFNMNY